MTGNTPNGNHAAPHPPDGRGDEGGVGTSSSSPTSAHVIGVFLASTLVGSRGSEAVEAWFFVALLAFGYALSRAGSPTPRPRRGPAPSLTGDLEASCPAASPGEVEEVHALRLDAERVAEQREGGSVARGSSGPHRQGRAMQQLPGDRVRDRGERSRRPVHPDAGARRNSVMKKLDRKQMAARVARDIPKAPT